jgi:hypothetical protein
VQCLTLYEQDMNEEAYHNGSGSDLVSRTLDEKHECMGYDRASTLATLVLRAAVIMDIDQLQNDILTALPNDPIASQHLLGPSNPRWTVDNSGFLHCDNHIYVPESNDLRLCILQNTYDHPLSGHFGQN